MFRRSGFSIILCCQLLDSHCFRLQFDKAVAEAVRRGVSLPVAEPSTNVLLVGGGGREHALAHKLKGSASVATVFVAPGNYGTEHMEGSKVRNVAIGAHQTAELVRFAQENDVSLVVVGPEQPLADGLTDAMHAKVCYFANTVH